MNLARGIRPENEIFLILLIVFILAFTLNRPRYVDAALSININESFGSKTAKISEELQLELMEIARSIDEKSRDHKFDGLEIIGHADTARITRTYGRWGYDLDKALAGYLDGNTSTITGRQTNYAQAASRLANDTVSNAELGMVRAVVVTQFFQELKRQGTLFQNIEYFVPMSAGSMVRTDYSLDTRPTGQGDAKRRRIEFQLFSTRDRSRDERPEATAP